MRSMTVYESEAKVMRALIAVVVVSYLVGVGVVLAPVFSANWNTGTPSQMFGSFAQEMPRALAWPVTAYHGIAGSDGQSSSKSAKG